MTWTERMIALVQSAMYHIRYGGSEAYPIPERLQRIEDYLFRRLKREENPA